jgi:hypothetical protein
MMGLAPLYRSNKPRYNRSKGLASGPAWSPGPNLAKHPWEFTPDDFPGQRITTREELIAAIRAAKKAQADRDLRERYAARERMAAAGNRFTDPKMNEYYNI